MNKTQVLNRAADNIRILAAAAVEKAKSGHPGGAMGGADFINVLFSEFLEYDPDNAGWEARDRFFLDPGHMAPMLYGQLCLAGKFTLEDLKNLRQWGSVTPEHVRSAWSGTHVCCGSSHRCQVVQPALRRDP